MFDPNIKFVLPRTTYSIARLRRVYTHRLRAWTEEGRTLAEFADELGVRMLDLERWAYRSRFFRYEYEKALKAPQNIPLLP